MGFIQRALKRLDERHERTVQKHYDRLDAQFPAGTPKGSPEALNAYAERLLAGAQPGQPWMATESEAAGRLARDRSGGASSFDAAPVAPGTKRP